MSRVLETEVNRLIRVIVSVVLTCIVFYAWQGECYAAGSATEDIVKVVYQSALGREPEASEMSEWVSGLEDKSRSLADLVENVLFSKEFEKAGYSNEQKVEIVYEGLLGRIPGDDERAYWQGYMDRGVSYRWVINGFLGSDELANRFRDSGITTGELAIKEERDKNTGTTELVWRTFTEAYDRSPDKEELNYWCKVVNDDPTYDNVRGIIRNDFLRSAEYKRRHLVTGEYLKVIYHIFLNRDGDAEGYGYWMHQIYDGTASKEDLAEWISGSDECRNLMASYGFN